MAIPCNQTYTVSKSLVVTVRSPSEAPVIIAPTQVVAVAGQVFSLPLTVSDADQDALSWTVSGLPAGAQLVQGTAYGQAVLQWQPGVDDLGMQEWVIEVRDSGLPPAGAGYTAPANPVANVTRHTLRVLVRDANQAPILLGAAVNGQSTELTTDTLVVAADEGAPLNVNLYAADNDGDLLSWTAANLPRGMRLTPENNGTRLRLDWTPDRLAAQDGNTGTPGLWRFTLSATDGVAVFMRTLEIRVRNVNQMPVLIPQPLKLVSEGDTVAFGLRGSDADGDVVRYALLRDAGTPDGVFFDAATGSFEWTPGFDTVDNAVGDDRAVSFRFRVDDGQSSSEQTVQVRVFDINRAPTLTVENHAVLVGNTLSLPVVRGSGATNGIRVSDADGAVQTANLTVAFLDLPAGADYDAVTGRLTWTPGPGQVGDTVVTALVGDGHDARRQTFTLRVVAEAAANAPQIAINLTPAFPVLPGQPA